METTLRKDASWLIGMLLLIGGLLGWSVPAQAQDGLLSMLTADSPQNLLSNGGFEAMKPAYWDATGAGATWTTDQARTPAWSLMLSGAGDAQWQQAEAVRNWVPGIPGEGNPELVVGGFVWTDGVNTAPASDADKFQLVFEFFDDAGADLLGGPLVLDVPQDQASSGGWVEISSASLGAIALPGEQAAKSARITFRKGASATGTVYLDDVFLRKADPNAEGWQGGWFNPNMDAGDTWYYWWADFDIGGDWPATQKHFQYVTAEEAHTGSYSLKIEENPLVADPSAETVAVTERVPVTEGEPVLLSFWVKHEGNSASDSIGTGNNNLGLTVLWYDNLEGGAAGWGEIGGVDIVLNGMLNDQPIGHLIPLLAQEASTGWTQYAFIAYPPEGAIGVEARPRYWHQFDGVTYWDDVFISSLGGNALIATGVEDELADSEVPDAFLLHQNYPNPFNPATTIAFDLPQRAAVTLAVYNVLGQRVATLLNDAVLPAGRQAVTFDASDLSSGMYLYVLQTEGGREVRKMVLLK